MAFPMALVYRDGVREVRPTALTPDAAVHLAAELLHFATAPRREERFILTAKTLGEGPDGGFALAIANTED